MNKSTFLIVACCLLGACGTPSADETGNDQATEITYKGINTAYLDTTTSPCEDFYQYAIGGWLKDNPIPESESRWSSFNELRDQNLYTLRKILVAAMNNDTAAQGSDIQKMGDFYTAAMDSTGREEKSLAPIQGLLERINAMASKEDLVKTIAFLHKSGIGVLFTTDVDIDMKNSEAYALTASQGGLSLPAPSLYKGELKGQLEEHMTNMYVLGGQDEASAKASAAVCIKLEERLAGKSMNRLQMRDVDAQYNKMGIDELIEKYPALNWDLYFEETGIKAKSPGSIIIAQLDFFSELNTMFTDVSIDDWKAYFTFHILSSMSTYLNTALEDEHVRFFSGILKGVKEKKPRWKMAVAQANHSLGEIIGKEYIKVAFSPEQKERLNKMIDNLMAVMDDRITKLSWMGEETKARAHEKLSKMCRKIAYPDQWKDYSSMEITADNYPQNVMNAAAWRFNYTINKLGKPVDKMEWGLPPQTVNAYYNPTTNCITFPAGILQPPFMDPEADDAVLYATTGAVIGHEMTHGFDDQGKLFDAIGNRNNWWTSDDSTHFAEKAAAIADQFDGYVAVDTFHVNGRLTLGENIADLGGLSIAYEAYQRSLAGKEAPVIDGFTADQRFCIAYAQVWKNSSRPEAMKKRILSDPHSPPRFRVIGTMSNMDVFYKAWGCKDGLVFIEPGKRAAIW